jgi:hypothetical protein
MMPHAPPVTVAQPILRSDWETLPRLATDFEAKLGETVTIDFETKLEKIVTTGFEAKLKKIVSVVLRTNH